MKTQFPDKVDVPVDSQYVGMDAYKKAIDQIAPGGVVILATPPAFRPLHLEYAVSKGVNVFMEKSFAVDAPGIRRVLKAGEEATKKNLKIAGGLMSRHSMPLERRDRKVPRRNDRRRDHLLGLPRARTGRLQSPQANDESELANQIRNYSCFTWLNGSFILDWLIHNLDVCCWVKDAWPVSAQGQGGRTFATRPISCSTTTPWNTRFPTVPACSPKAGTSPVAGDSSATSSTAPQARPCSAKGSRSRASTRGINRRQRI